MSTEIRFGLCTTPQSSVDAPTFVASSLLILSDMTSSTDLSVAVFSSDAVSAAAASGRVVSAAACLAVDCFTAGIVPTAGLADAALLLRRAATDVASFRAASATGDPPLCDFRANLDRICLRSSSASRRAPPASTVSAAAASAAAVFSALSFADFSVAAAGTAAASAAATSAAAVSILACSFIILSAAASAPTAAPDVSTGAGDDPPLRTFAAFLLAAASASTFTAAVAPAPDSTVSAVAAAVFAAAVSAFSTITAGAPERAARAPGRATAVPDRTAVVSVDAEFTGTSIPKHWKQRRLSSLPRLDNPPPPPRRRRKKVPVGALNIAARLAEDIHTPASTCVARAGSTAARTAAKSTSKPQPCSRWR